MGSIKNCKSEKNRQLYDKKNDGVKTNSPQNTEK